MPPFITALLFNKYTGYLAVAAVAALFAWGWYTNLKSTIAERERAELATRQLKQAVQELSDEVKFMQYLNGLTIKLTEELEASRKQLDETTAEVDKIIAGSEDRESSPVLKDTVEALRRVQ